MKGLFKFDPNRQYLIHYTDDEKIFKILENFNLKYSTLEKTNDPKEYFLPYIGYAFNDFLSLREVEARFITDFKKYNILCFSEPQEHEFDFSYKKSSRWHQYANKHKGCCLIIDRDLFESELKKQGFPPLRVINYNLEEILSPTFSVDEYFSDDMIKSFIDSNAQYYFYTKSKDWKEENEVRSVIFNQTQENVLISIKKSLVHIILGHNFSTKKVKRIFSLLEQASLAIQISQMGWFNGIGNVNDTYDNYFDYLLALNTYLFDEIIFKNKDKKYIFASRRVLLNDLQENDILCNQDFNYLQQVYIEICNVPDSLTVNQLIVMFRRLRNIYTCLYEGVGT